RSWNGQRIENSTDGESGDQKPSDRAAGLANAGQQESDVRKEPVDEDCFEEHGREADLGARIGKDAAEIGQHCRAIERRRCRRRPRKAKNAGMATINPNAPRIAKTPRQPNTSPITPAIEAPTRLPVSPTAGNRTIGIGSSPAGPRRGG